MTVKQKGKKWYVVKKGGRLGKRGYTSAANAKKAQARGRALAKKNPLKGGSKRSTKPSNPSGGAKTTVKEKIGVWIKRGRTILNFSAPGLSAYSPKNAGLTGEEKLYKAVAKYTGYRADLGNWKFERAADGWKGMAVSAINEWFDRKTGTAGKISRGKFVHIAKEVIPMLTAHFRTRNLTKDRTWWAVNSYNKQTTGYDAHFEDFDLGRVNEYATLKALALGYDYIVPSSWKQSINRLFPKGINPA